MNLAPIVLTAPALAIAIFSSSAGYLLDKAGRRTCFLAAMFIYALLGTAPLWIENPYLIVASRFGLGMTEAVILAATMTLAGDYFSGPVRDRWIAYMMAVAAFSAILFYISGGILGGISWKAPFAAYGISFFIFLAAIPLIFEPQSTRHATMTSAAGRGDTSTPSTSLAIIAVFAATFVGSILFYIVPLQLGGFLAARGIDNSATIGLLIAVAGLGNPLGSYSFGYLRKLPFALLLGGSATVSGLGLLLATASHDVSILVIGAFINQLGCGMLCPLTMATVLRLAPAHRRGINSGGWSTAFFVGQFFSPLVVLPLTSLESEGDGLSTLAATNILFGLLSYILFSRMGATALNPEPEKEGLAAAARI